MNNLIPLKKFTDADPLYLSGYVAESADRAGLSPVKLAYCDYIAARIREALGAGPDPERLLKEVGRVEWDLHPEQGYFVSTKKTLYVSDRNGKRYRVTVEECGE